MEEPPRIDSRWERLLAYLQHNRDRMVVDLSLVVTWVLLTTTLFEVLDLHRWLLYIVLFVGIVFYTRVTPVWTRPYQSPDGPELD